jgi:hypothetical protein
MKWAKTLPRFSVPYSLMKTDGEALSDLELWLLVFPQRAMVACMKIYF